ncbi:MAG TPA: MmgE/PrpD family protein [Marmoricola sp.]
MIAADLAAWAAALAPTPADHVLADRALLDSIACAVAARQHPVVGRSRALGEAGRWGVATHVLDLDDLHLPSTTHISTVCVPATLAAGGNARDYLAGAGVMARLGTALGWSHYTAGWHATTTAGAMGAAACAASAFGLDAERVAVALALAVPASGGVQRAFGTDAKSLQVGMAVEAGIRAARLARDGAGADVTAVDAWLPLVGACSREAADLEPGAPAVPGGLAIKIHPCCYALQRPIAAVHGIRGGIDPDTVQRVVVRTPQGTVTPLIHARPRTGLEGKFSLEYAVAAALLDEHCGLASFTDEAVRRPAAVRLVELVEVELSPGGDGLLDGEVDLDVHAAGKVHRARLQLPPGAPQRPPTDAEMARKVEDCLAGTGLAADDVTWTGAPDLLRSVLGSA